jgi:membrane-associated protein
MYSLVDFILHFDKHLTFILQHFGVWTYLILFLIIFCETGLVVTPFLPGDSLLFIVGAFSANGAFNLTGITLALVAAAIAGDSVNYAVGKYFGNRLLNAKKIRLIKKEYLDKTHAFFEKYGAKTIVFARFVPIVRTFAPFVAGLGQMNYGKFLLYNILGGALWVVIFVMGGYYFGNISLVKEHLTLVILIIIFISILPGLFHFFKSRKPSAGV